jgi:predicted dehydrogenase
MDRVRLGLIGMGLIGRRHAETLHALEECTLAAISDVDAATADTARSLGASHYGDYTEMLREEQLDGVIIATPNHLHASMGVACAERGLHLFVEKPITHTLPEADRLIEATRRHGVRMLVGHQRRFNPLLEAARDIVRGGALGHLVGVTITWALRKPPEYFEGPFAWRRAPGGGPILINLIHEVDNLRFVCGEIVEVFAATSNRVRGFPVEDTAAAVLRFEHGAVGTALLSDCVPSRSAYEATTGENPSLHHGTGNCYQFYGTQGTLLFPEMKRLCYGDCAGGDWRHPITEQGMPVPPPEDPYARALRHFARVVRGDEPSRVSGADARRTLEVTLAIQRSGETGQPVRLHG